MALSLFVHTVFANTYHVTHLEILYFAIFLFVAEDTMHSTTSHSFTADSWRDPLRVPSPHRQRGSTALLNKLPHVTRTSPLTHEYVRARTLPHILL